MHLSAYANSIADRAGIIPLGGGFSLRLGFHFRLNGAARGWVSDQAQL